MRIKMVALALALAPVLALGGCLGSSDKAPETAATKTIDPEKPRDTCQHTAMGGEPRTICY